MAQGKIDENFEKVLANLEKHPAVFKRAQKVYLYRVTQRASYEAIANHFGVVISTAQRYCKAYQRVAHKYVDDASVIETLRFVHNEMFELITRRKDAAASTQEYTSLTKEIRRYLEIENELTGLTTKAPTVQINFINNFVSEVVEIISRNVDDEATRRRIGDELRARGQRLVGGGTTVTVPATVAGEPG